MPGPFYNAIKGTCTVAPGTGAFTPTGAAPGALAWPNVPAGWVGLVRFEDGTAWELRYAYWNGTTLSRGANAFVASSTGSGLTLSSSATASLINDANEVAPHPAAPFSQYKPIIGGTTLTAIGLPAAVVTGTAAAGTIAGTNYLTEQPRVQYTSATTASAEVSVSPANNILVWGVAAGRGGFEVTTRFGVTQLPTGPRLWCGANGTSVTGEPSAVVNTAIGFGKDSTDTNIQFMTNSVGSGSATKIDTGIALAVNGWYEACYWVEPGGGRAYGLLIRLDTGEIFFTSTTTDIPNAVSLMRPSLQVGLSATTGTAAIVQFGGMTIRNAS